MTNKELYYSKIIPYNIDITSSIDWNNRSLLNFINWNNYSEKKLKEIEAEQKRKNRNVVIDEILE